MRDETLPPPKRGQLLVRVRAAALNPRDVLVQSGQRLLYRLLAGPRFPKRLGYDWSGEVVACGPGTAEFHPGDALYGMIGGWSGGACATHALVDATELARKPERLSWEAAAAVPLSALTALQALRDVAGVREGTRLLIHGSSGGVGTFALQIGKLLGARITAVTRARNAELVRSLGADTILDYETDADLRSAGEHDVFFDVCGSRSYGFAAGLLAAGGTYVSTVPRPSLARDVLRTTTTLFGSRRARFVRVRSDARDLTALTGWVERGVLRPVVGRVFDFDELPRAEQLVASRQKQGKVVLRILANADRRRDAPPREGTGRAAGSLR